MKVLWVHSASAPAQGNAPRVTAGAYTFYTSSLLLPHSGVVDVVVSFETN